MTLVDVPARHAAETELPPPPPPPLHDATTPAPEVRRRLGGVDREQVGMVVGSMFAALALAWLLVERILPWSGTIGFWVTWYLLFLGVYAFIVVQRRGKQELTDRLAAVVFSTAGASVVAVILMVTLYTLYRGYKAIRPSFFTQTMSVTGPLSPLHVGGVQHAIVGSLEQISIALAVAVPLGIAAALFLNEVKGPLARPVRMLVDAMSAIPSIVAGLFILATVILTLGVQKCGVAASLAIGVEMLPVITRASELVFRLVPGGLREASTALGSTQWRTVWRVVLPTARAGLATAIVLGIARGIGETAPVLLVSGFTSDMNANPFHGAQVSLPLYILTYVKYPQDTMITRAYGAGLALLIVVMILFVAARLIGGSGPGHLSKRQRNRIDRTRAARPSADLTSPTAVTAPTTEGPA